MAGRGGEAGGWGAGRAGTNHRAPFRQLPEVAAQLLGSAAGPAPSGQAEPRSPLPKGRAGGKQRRPPSAAPERPREAPLPTISGPGVAGGGREGEAAPAATFASSAPAAKSNQFAGRLRQWAARAGWGRPMSVGPLTSRGAPRPFVCPMAPGRSAEGPPRAFVQSLRPLYDILDERRRGYVHLREIESRWLQPGGEAGPLPPGVLEGLRRAAPASGYLTFERFVLGLRLALLGPEPADGPAEPAGGKLAGGADGPLTDPPPPLKRGARPGGGAPRSLEQSSHGGQAEQQLQGKRAAGEAGGSRKPREQLENEGPCKERRRQLSIRGERRRHTITHGVDYEMLKQMKELEKEKDFLLQGLELVEEARGWYHQQLHRLQGHQKQLARSKGRQEEESRMQLSQLFPQVQELNRCLWQLLSLSAKPGNSSPTTSHSPPATLLGPSPSVGPHQTINMLKEQNRLLTKEVTDKGHRITQLEQEKSALIKQLFGARAESTKDSNQLDSTFI
ncbi:suppressor APC domain-containing protein 2 [Ahaetulla prasina]|uniref:suppressor APC domain-containing protein 2 n=1 Tax=Ahaetulla prasina TaxID=499056 RepID=UPI00264A2F8C|nr:suppressor APC domain-containing protein 2 [Ahaetulla prasina]